MNTQSNSNANADSPVIYGASLVIHSQYVNKPSETLVAERDRLDDQLDQTILRLGETQERMIDAERQRDEARVLADRLAALLQRNRDGYGGQMVDPECGCCDCKWLQPIDEALAAWKEARSES